MVPVNTNYRYGDDELVYLWDNADAVGVVFHGSFVPNIERIRTRVPRVRTWLWVDDGAAPCPEWATPYESAAAAAGIGGVGGVGGVGGGERAVPPWGRSGDDLYMLYTGGTTGMPKGVMWRQDDLVSVLSASNFAVRFPEDGTIDDVRAQIEKPGLVAIPACPLMHGTGAFTAFSTLQAGGCVVTLTSRSFDAAELLSTVERERVNVLASVGDAFAKPMLRALEANPGKWDISSLIAIVSSGVMWSEETKQGLLRHHGGMLLVDAFSSSEALGMGQSVSSAGGTTSTAKFMLGDNAIVVTEDGRKVEAGSDEVGRVAVKGRQPVGYYKDEAKTAATFITVDGERYSMPGDYARVEADGSLTLLGRGSVCINTGGEKVFPEEVEEAVKTHPSVRDAVVVGVPDERFGEAITALVEPHDGEAVDEGELVAHVKGRLAAYKAPKRVLRIDTIGRAPNGKVDYKRLRQYAADQIGVTA